MTFSSSDLLTEKQVATILNCSIQFLQRSRWRKTGPTYTKIGRMVRYKLSDIKAYINANTLKAI
jgi:hypothetical protein